MKINFRIPTTFEEALQQCNVLLENKMQCEKKIYKAITTNELPENPTLINVRNNQFYMCRAHFNSFLDVSRNNKSNSITDENETLKQT